MKKITITNAYTWDNKGDAGILLGIVEELKQVFSHDVEFTILSFTPLKDFQNYSKDKTIKQVYSNILNPHPYVHTKIGKIKAMIKLVMKAIKTSFGLRFFKDKMIKKDKTLEALAQSDIIVVCGGGFLGGKKLESLMHLYQININTKFGKPVYVMGTSIEPLKNKLVKYYTEKILKKVDFVYAREEITENYLSTFMDINKHDIIPDMAFMLGQKTEEVEFINELKKQGRKLIGITVRKWNFPNSKDKEAAKNKYSTEVAHFIEECIQKYHCIFIFIPQVIVEYASDVDMAKEIKEKLSQEYQDSFLIREDDWSPTEIKNVIGQLVAFVGTRMHSNIFATSMGIPTLAIAYEKKTNGIMRTVNLENYVEEIEVISSQSLGEKMELIIENQERICENLKQRIPEIKQEIDTKIRARIK
jgi:colanic acid/amylovoran biosynthesis protein